MIENILVDDQILIEWHVLMETHPACFEKIKNRSTPMGVLKTEISEKNAMKTYCLTSDDIQKGIIYGILHPITKKARLGDYRAYLISEIEKLDSSRPFDLERKKNQQKERIKILKKKIIDARKALEKNSKSLKPMTEKARVNKDRTITSLEKELNQLEAMELNEPIQLELEG
jgi:hypothetical protein